MSEEKSQKICDYYLTKRGCAKGDRCDFLHEGGKPNPSVEDLDLTQPKTCAFYISERGCIKGEKCDFSHPVAPNGNETTKVCEYYQQPRGCVKAERCDFLHVKQARGGRGMAGGPPGGAPGGGGGDVMEAAMRAQAYANQLAVAAGMMPGYPQMSGMSGMGGYPSGGGSDKPGERPSVMTLASTTGNSRVCNFYQTDRGCAKSEKCDFIHQGPSDGGAAAGGYGAAAAGGYGAAGYGAAGYDAAGYAAAAGFGGFFWGWFRGKFWFTVYHWW